jgi:hypothetical protein
MSVNKICPFISTSDEHATCIKEKCMLYDINECVIVKILDAVENKNNED